MYIGPPRDRFRGVCRSYGRVRALGERNFLDEESNQFLPRTPKKRGNANSPPDAFEPLDGLPRFLAFFPFSVRNDVRTCASPQERGIYNLSFPDSPFPTRERRAHEGNFTESRRLKYSLGGKLLYALGNFWVRERAEQRLNGGQ